MVKRKENPKRVGSGILTRKKKKGFDNTCYNRAKMEALTKLAKRMEENQRVCNLRMDVEDNNCTVFVHLFGSLYEK